MTDTIHLGFEHGTGEPVSVPITHSLATAITRHGKSVTMEAMADRAAAEGYTVLLFDVKAKRDYADVGTEVPIYFHETADPITIKSLLENVVDAPVSVDFAELVKVYEQGDDYSDVLGRVREAIEDDRHPVEENKLIVIEHLLDRLVGDLDTVDIQDELDLETGVNVMDLSEMDDAVQQIAISSTVEEINGGWESVIVGIDEAHNFIPQQGSPPANKPIVNLIREGGASENWVWFSDQTVTGIDKDPLKQVDLWLFGRQREQNEVDRVRDQIGKSEYSDADVKEMPKGHFVVDTGGDKRFVYVQPVWMDEAAAADVAIGGPEAIDDIDEPEPEDMSDIEDELAEKEQRIAEQEETIDELRETIDEQQEQIEKLNDLLESETADGDDEGITAPMPSTTPGFDVYEDEIREMFDELFDDRVDEYEAPEEVTVDAVRGRLVVRRRVEPVEVDTESRLGRVAYLYATGELPEDVWFTTGDVADILERVGWGDTSIKRTSVLTDLTEAGFFEMKIRSDRTRMYRLELTPAEAEERGLLEVDEEVVG